jgi:hypothetical protein
MNPGVSLKWFLGAVVAMALQVLFLRDIALANVAFCFIYVWVMVKAPMRVATPLLLVVAFFAGWIIDVFYNTHGLHAFATVMLALVRPTFFRILTPANGYDERSEISLSEMKWLWFFSYVGLMLITHHMILFLFEASDWALFGLSMLRALSSAMLGLIVFGLLEFFNRGQ